MVEPWIEPAWKFGAYYGAGMGTLCGLLGATLGGLGGGYLIPRGIGRTWVLGAMAAAAVVGAAHLIAGAYAWSVGQPYAIWYTLVGAGLPMTLVFGCLYPVIAARYREAEQRKIDAAGLRNA